MEQGLTKNMILSELSRSPHGKLTEYIPVGQKAAKTEAEFFAHLIAWDAIKGQIRDAKVALPCISLSVSSFPSELAENSLAHLAKLNPRELLKAYRFFKELKIPHKVFRHKVRPLVVQYLNELEKEFFIWERVALQHRHTLKELYNLTYIYPKNEVAHIILHGHTRDSKVKAELPKNSVFYHLSQLSTMSVDEAAGTILRYKIPFLIAKGALGKKMEDKKLVLALIKNMTATELITNTAMLEKLGVNKDPALKGVFNEALEEAQKSTKNILKTTRAAEKVKDTVVREKLRGVQDKQIANMAVEGDWLVLADKSGSMTHAIEMARQLSATLVKMVKGKVWLVFFDVTPQTMDVTGLALDAIQAKTKFVTANGGTSIGCGLQRMLEANTEVDGIAIVSDGGENGAPFFADTYRKYTAKFGKEVPVYFYALRGDAPVLIGNMKSAQLDLQVFDLTGANFDYYSLPNLVATMRTNRYSLVDEVMATPLLTIEEVFKSKSKKKEELVTV